MALNANKVLNSGKTKQQLESEIREKKLLVSFMKSSVYKKCEQAIKLICSDIESDFLVNRYVRGDMIEYYVSLNLCECDSSPLLIFMIVCTKIGRKWEVCFKKIRRSYFGEPQVVIDKVGELFS